MAHNKGRASLTIPQWLNDELMAAVVGLDPLFEGPKKLTKSRVLELLLVHFQSSPPSADWLRNFEFQCFGPGRPRKLKLRSGPQPTDREVQHDTDQNEGRREADDHSG